MNIRYAEKVIRYVLEHNIIEPEIKLKNDYIELVWWYNGKVIKAHIDCLDHMDYILCHDKQYKELDRDVLVDELRELYGIPK
jgi:hypothetical protein